MNGKPGLVRKGQSDSAQANACRDVQDPGRQAMSLMLCIGARCPPAGQVIHKLTSLSVPTGPSELQLSGFNCDMFAAFPLFVLAHR